MRMQRADGSASIVVKAGSGGRTALDQLHQRANAKVRIPRASHSHLEAVLINTSGGLTGGDHLVWRCEAGANTALVVTTQAAERIYRSAGGHAVQNTQLTVASGARLDWLPQETILFDESRLERTLEVDLAEGAAFLGLETLVFGRQAMGETVTRLSLSDRWRIRRAGRLVHAESVRIDGDAAALLARAPVTGGWCAVATIMLVPATDEGTSSAADALRQAALTSASGDGLRIGVTALPGRLVARIIARDSYVLRPTLATLISALRGNHPLPAVWRS